MASAAGAIRGTAQKLNIGWASIATLFVFLDMILWILFPPGSDWAPLWTAGRLAWTNVAGIYDFDLLAQLQLPITGNADFHPYIYPPSALLLIAPISLLRFWLSAALVVGGSLIILAAATRRIGSDPLLVVLAPPVVLAAIVGQTSLCVIGLVVLACAHLDRRQLAAGAFLALAALIKPTLLVLAPIGLVAGGYWKALAAAISMGLAGIAASLVLFGFQPWFDWLEAIPRFQQLFAENEPLVRNAVTPYAFAVRYGFGSNAIIALGAVVAAVVTWMGFSRRTNVGNRSALLMGGALLFSPYSMSYELAACAPALLALPRDNWRNLGICALWASSMFLNLSVFGLLIAYAVSAWPVVASSLNQADSNPATSC